MGLKDIIRICKEFIEDSENEKIVKEYNDLLNSIIVKSYMPMQEKVVALVRMLMDNEREIDVESSFFTAGLELACCFDGLLAYTNIDPEVDIAIKNYENYDIIYQSGLADYILQYCEKDYERLVKMMERTLSFENLREMINSLSSMDSGMLREVVNALKGVKKDLDSETIKNIADIMRLDDPLLTQIKETIVDSALQDLEQEKEQKDEQEEGKIK